MCKKSFIFFIAILGVFLFSSLAYADSTVYESGIYKYKKIDGGICIIQIYDSNKEEYNQNVSLGYLDIPNKIDGYKVKDIAKGAVKRCSLTSNIESIQCSDYMSVVDMQKFNGYTIRKVTLGKYTKSYKPSMRWWPNIKSATVDVSIPKDAKYLKKRNNCIYSKDGKTLYHVFILNNNKTFAVPKGVSKIYKDAFKHSGRYKIKLPSTIRTIQKNSFDLTTTIYVPSKYYKKYKTMIKKAAGSKAYKALKIKKY